MLPSLHLPPLYIYEVTKCPKRHLKLAYMSVKLNLKISGHEPKDSIHGAAKEINQPA